MDNHEHRGPAGVNHRRKKRRINPLNGQNLNGQHNESDESLTEQRCALPIAKGRVALVAEIEKYDVTVLIGETGSGKTTQVPQYILESGMAGSGMIAVTQPRRVAATSLAARVAAEQGTNLGALIGYSVRFDERCSAETRIKYLTDGMIVRELLSDPMLSRYSVIVVDEAHERTIRTDTLLSNLKLILKTRNAPVGSSQQRPLKVVVMSATLDAEKFSAFFDFAKIIYVKGRQHPVNIHHTALSQTDYVDAALRTFFQIHTNLPSGDVLIFLPGQEDIEALEKMIQLYANQLPREGMQVTTFPMFAALPSHQQSKMFLPAPPNFRKCILATNIAETSITIPGIKYVVDTGKCKEKRYLAREIGGGFDTLLTRDISQSSATQRAGRAGREGKGSCFRLYTEDAFKSMEATTEPEIRRCSLTSCILQLKCLGQDLEDMEFLDKPEADSIIPALKSLWLMDALDNSKTLTKLGREMAVLPLEPSHARIIIASKEHKCTSEVIDIISVMSASSKLFFDSSDQREAAAEARLKFRHSSGDHLTILSAMRAYQEILKSESKGSRKDWCRRHFLNERTLQEAIKIRDQVRMSCSSLKMEWSSSCGDNIDPILSSLFCGLVQNAALLQPDGSYKQITGHSHIKIYPGSTLANQKVPAIVYDELVSLFETRLEESTKNLRR